MSAVRVHPSAPEVTRNGVSRFAERLQRERDETRRLRLLDEERNALRVAILSTCQRDRSAAQRVADAFSVDLSTVYRWCEGEIENNPLRMLCRPLDACIAAKGTDNAAALEPVRLLRRRYLDGETKADLAGVVGTCASAMKEAGEAVAAAIAAARDGWVARDEVSGIEVEIDEAVAALDLLRREVQACTGTR